MTYLARITECEHGIFDTHEIWTPIEGHPVGGEFRPCPGGTTTRIEPDYEAAIETRLWENDDLEVARIAVRAIVDAALGGNE
jgi:hypothetical protein